jgi:hypothetical protein
MFVLRPEIGRVPVARLLPAPPRLKLRWGHHKEPVLPLKRSAHRKIGFDGSEISGLAIPGDDVKWRRT